MHFAPHTHPPGHGSYFVKSQIALSKGDEEGQRDGSEGKGTGYLATEATPVTSVQSLKAGKGWERPDSDSRGLVTGFVLSKQYGHKPMQ